MHRPRKLGRPPCACSKIYDPVTCASDGKTYGNACLASCAHQSGCKIRVRLPEDPRCRDLRGPKVYNNACIAECAGRSGEAERASADARMIYSGDMWQHFATGSRGMCMNGIAQHQTIFMSSQLAISLDTPRVTVRAILGFASVGSF